MLELQEPVHFQLNLFTTLQSQKFQVLAYACNVQKSSHCSAIKALNFPSKTRVQSCQELYKS